ncbi:MAG: hypothetical protein ABSC61_03645 [Anaerolineales bacterium]
MEKDLSAVVAGHICLDIIPAMPAIPPGGFKEPFLPGYLLEVGAAALSPGGAVSNTGLALRRLGIPAQLICKPGDMQSKWKFSNLGEVRNEATLWRHRSRRHKVRLHGRNRPGRSG